MKFLLVPILLISALLFSSCASQDDNTLVVGMDLSYPPFEMTDAQDQPAGISVEMAKALGAYLDRPVRIENIAFAGLIPSLKTGKIDLIISSLTANEERARSIDFSDPYLETGLCLLVSKNSIIEGIEALDRSEFSVAVKQGTTGHLWASENLKAATILPVEKEASAVLEVAQGKADAFIYDQMSTFRNWQRHPDTTKPLLSPFKAELWAIGLQKGNDSLREEVNSFLEKFKAEGGFEKLGDTYLSKEKKAFKELGYPFLF